MRWLCPWQYERWLEAREHDCVAAVLGEQPDDVDDRQLAERLGLRTIDLLQVDVGTRNTHAAYQGVERALGL